MYTRRFTASSTFVCYSVMEDSDGAIWVTGSENGEAVVIKVDADGNFENCTNDPIQGITSPTTFVETPFTWTREDVYTFNNIAFTPTVRDITFQIDSLCKAPTCGAIELTGPQAICNLADSATYVASKTGMCATNLQWTLPAGTSSRMVNDSTVRLLFSAAGTYMIIAENNIACSVLRDTITVTVAPSPRSINLGNDTLICSANALSLDAGAVFARYVWQNNSTGQTLTVNASGTYYVTAWNLCNEQFSDTIVVNYRQPSDFTVTPQDTAYCVALGPIQFLASGGHTYQWTPATYLNDPQIANPVGTPTASIQYLVTITDTVCHISRDLPVNVTVTPSPRSINLGNDTLLCNAGTLVLDAGAGFTRYQWQNNSTAQTLSVSTSGTYYVSAWNNCNEEFTDTIVVSYRLPADFTVTPMDTTYCTPLAPIQFTATGGHLYQWTPATYLNDPQISNPVGMPTSSINYTVTITDTVCNRTQDLTVRVAVTPSPALNLGNDTLLCNASTLVLDAGAGFARYQWQDNSTAQTLSVNTPGTYYVRAWNNCNEESTDTIVVSYRLPTDFAVTPMDTTYCTPLAPIQFTATGGHLYQWTPATYLNNAQISNPVGMPTSSINYTVTITDTVCNRTQDLTVRVAVTPSPALNLGNDTVLCNAGVLVLDAGAGFTRYQWQDNSTSQTHTLSTAGTYYVNAWNSCNEEVSDTVQVSYRLPDFSVTPLDTAYCTATDPIRFSASGGHLYRWSPSTYLNNAQISNPVGTPDASILYNVTITDTVCNRTRDLSVNITVNQAPDLVLSKSNDITCSVAVTQLLVTGASRYEWIPDASLSALNIPNPVAKPDRTTTYMVRGFSDLGCETLDSITVNFEKIGISTIQLPSAFTPNGDGRNDIFRVIAPPSVEVKEFLIFNRWGELIFTSNNAAKGWNGTYKGAMQEAGAYYWFVKAVSPCGGDLFKKGNVILIR
ncbi:T9SS type B sorting domain-containing protein [Chitinophaga pinensis]|uniref:Gliding motility-associated C-terminal domain-containing protein n=1 Tax=Chitinophaga pinensis TaxID=79329 RepID=A0A5C6M073_9BACT|nr:T9SS type B sorting domain-containing protein [Chitinophaga pinensis]TWW02280.1 gliding motility-associated C-terminal domain-containing protein [Chitinophaga pinensis]